MQKLYICQHGHLSWHPNSLATVLTVYLLPSHDLWDKSTPFTYMTMLCTCRYMNKVLREASQYSAHLANQLFKFFALMWNIGRGIENGNLPDFGSHDLALLASIQDIVVRFQWDHPLRDFAVPPRTDEAFFASAQPGPHVLAKARKEDADYSRPAGAKAASLDGMPPD